MDNIWDALRSTVVCADFCYIEEMEGHLLNELMSRIHPLHATYRCSMLDNNKSLAASKDAALAHRLNGCPKQAFANLFEVLDRSAYESNICRQLRPSF